jgi:hypothetical protein
MYLSHYLLLDERYQIPGYKGAQKKRKDGENFEELSLVISHWSLVVAWMYGRMIAWLHGVLGEWGDGEMGCWGVGVIG